MAGNRKMIYMSLLVACGVALHLVENLIPVPFPVPGAKLGLANIISLLAIALYGTKEGLQVNILRCLIGALMGGSMSSLLYSLSGAVSSTLMMGMAYRYFKNIFSLVGISIIGGVTHNIAQVTVASLVLSTFGLYSYLPFLMVVGLLTGIFTGFAAVFTRDNLAVNLSRLETTGKKEMKP
ncbi:Gx transporter family protein [Thermosediminibacter litoriperuensis]|uniref:Heptaprenyl diphosphate synthase n=1 Tax=Thermosediminibacter litoriperuensis TaxID=291989 RepID=A0A5S5AXR8_9FIRM|nr:Gx transporter family protein [Thermosediminibacter litoriperuensis]TYP57620.1 heptaprenyl diphosphate synthase [Thermosediminibacter litoriperuensis]